MTREFRTVLTANYNGVLINNVFHYTSSSNTLGQADNLNAAFELTVLPEIQAVQHIDVTYDTVYSIDTNTLTDYNLRGLTATGLRGSGGTALPAFIGFSFTYNTVASVIRHGYKRFAGVNRDDVIDDAPSGTLLALLVTLGDTLELPLSNGGFTFVPIIPRYSTSSPPVMTSYALISACNFKRISSQNTRKT